MPRNEDANLLVGFETSDDAGVYRLNDEQAMIVTADYITPPCDDPHLFGQIAAANALSDVYAMGGRPLTCLNLLGFPADKLGEDVLHGIIAGAAEKIREAGAVLAGGHSIEDEEPKFGLSVTGIVHPERVWKNHTAQVGDALLLTKPIGSGVLLNANLKGWVSRAAMQQCFTHLATLNHASAAALRPFTVQAVTDITGFGLAGHALEMAKGCGHTFAIDVAQVPFMEEAQAMYERGMSTGVNLANRLLVAADTEFPAHFTGRRQELLVDPQTSGGLLVALPEAEAEQALQALHDAGSVHSARIGSVQPRAAKALRFR